MMAVAMMTPSDAQRYASLLRYAQLCERDADSEADPAGRVELLEEAVFARAAAARILTGGGHAT